MALADGEVIARVLGGDTEAFAVLFHKYARMVHALALARTTRPAAAAEITRKVFEKVYEGLEDLPEGVRFSQHLFQAVAEEAAAHARDHGRSLQMLRVGPKEARRAATGGADLRTVMTEMRKEDAALVLLELTGRLPPQYEVPFLLRYLEGMEYAEIAEATGQSPAEVRTALDGARRLFDREFRHALEKAG